MSEPLTTEEREAFQATILWSWTGTGRWPLAAEAAAGRAEPSDTTRD